jgi:LPXTG cell wall anchor motif
VSAESLPLTGADVARMLALGLMMLSSGLAMRLVPGGKRR